MKPRIFPLIACCLSGVSLAVAQVPVTSPPATLSDPGLENNPNSSIATTPASQRTSAQLDQLLGPIALYPDALIALILPAAAAPSDIVLAARYLDSDGDPAHVDDQPWDDSVRALAHYPDIVKWMDQNLAWTKQVGEAFVDQPTDVMQSMQRLREAARAAGTLMDTPQQQVLTEGDNISIVPAQPDVIYVPTYDPEIVYLPQREFYPGPYLTFGVGYPVGAWLGFDLDWRRHRVWVIDRRERERFWRDHHDWHPRNPSTEPRGQTWTPNPTHTRPTRPDFNRSHPEIVRPAPFVNGAPRVPSERGNRPDGREPVRPDHLPNNGPARPPDERRFTPHRPETNPATPPTGQIQPQTPAPVFNRGTRVLPPPTDGHSRYEEHGRFTPPPGGQTAVPAVRGGVISPVQPPLFHRPPPAVPEARRERDAATSAASPSPAQSQPSAPQATAPPSPPPAPATDPQDNRQFSRGHR